MFQISKEGLLGLLSLVPSRVINDVVFSDVGDKLIIKGITKGNLTSFYQLSTPTISVSGDEETPFGVFYKHISEKAKNIKDDVLELEVMDDGLFITGKNSKVRSYRLPFVELNSDFTSFPKNLSITVEVGRYTKRPLVGGDDVSVYEYPREIVIPGEIRKDIVKEISKEQDNDVITLIRFRPRKSTLYFEYNRVFTTFEFDTDIDFEYDLVANFGFRYVMDLIPEDAIIHLSEKPKFRSYQICYKDNVFVVGAIDPDSKYAKEFIGKCLDDKDKD